MRYILLSLLFALAAVSSAYAQISANPTSGCATLIVSFTSNVPNAVAYAWTFQTGNTSTLANPTASFPNSGIFNVTLTATLANGTQQTFTQPITVAPTPKPSFSAAPTAVCLGDPINFTSTTTNVLGPSYVFDFGNGITVPQQSLNYTYPQAGTYTVKLTVTNSNGCSAFTTQTNVVTVNPVPSAAFTGSPLTACNPPLMTNFVATTAAGTHAWTFGNGGSSSLASPSNQYGAAGQYTVSHTITNNFGCSDTVTQPNMVIVSTNAASMMANKNPACVSDVITFSVGAGYSNVQWTFSNGNATGSPVNRVFTTAGNQTVTVSAINAQGCPVQGTMTVKINGLPTPDFTYSLSPVPTCNPPITASFTITQPTSFNSVVWNFDVGGANISSTVFAPTHTYTGAGGNYLVSLLLTDVNGCQAKKVNTVAIPNYNISINAKYFKGCKPLADSFVVITSNSLSPNVQWTWNFGDGTPTVAGTNNKMTHTFVDTGVYKVKLYTQNADGCTDSTMAIIQVGQHVIPDFSIANPLVCATSPAIFKNLSVPVAKLNYWDFGDNTQGISVKNDSVFRTYKDTGWMDVKLITDFYGCLDSITKFNYVYVSAPIAKFMIPSSSCNLPTLVSPIDSSLAPQRWRWNFGTGNPADTAVGKTPSFTYTQPGLYNVFLRVYNDITGCKDSLQQLIFIDPVEVKMVASPKAGCLPLAVNFTPVTVLGTPTAYSWILGNGAPVVNTLTASTIYSSAGTYFPKIIVQNAIGCQSVYTDTIKASKVTVGYTASPAGGCTPFSTQLTGNATSAYPITSWNWTVGTTSLTGKTPTYSTTLAGQTPVTLTITDSIGCTETATGMLSITQPAADFSVQHTINCPNNIIAFTNLSTGASSFLYSWDFGDGNIGTAASPSHSYAAAGVYTVSLTITDPNGCVSTMTKPNYISIDTPKISFFASNLSAACPPMTTNFTFQGLSSHTFNQWAWNLGDNTTAVVVNPSKTYTAPGSYTVSLTATAASGCTATFIRPNYITLGGPMGIYAVTPTTVCVGDTVTITAISANTQTYYLDFGDGTLITSTTGTANHAYTLSNPAITPYVVLKDVAGCQYTLPNIGSVNVRPLPNADFAVPKPYFCDYEQVSLLDKTQSTDPITTWNWVLGNGMMATGASPTFQFTQADTVDVQLSVISSFGCKDTAFRPLFLKILPSPKAKMKLALPSPCVPAAATLTDSSTSVHTIKQWLWDFGNGVTSTQHPSVSVTYPTVGTYPILLAVTDTFGCIGFVRDTIRTKPLPIPDFSANKLFSCAPQSIQFTDLTANAVQWNWDFGDSKTATTQNPAHPYTQNGAFSVTLKVWDSNGCAASVAKPNYITYSTPVAAFSADSLQLCPGIPLNVTSNSTSLTPIASQTWQFGDNTTASGATASHTYATGGKYIVVLQVTDTAGCADTATAKVTVRPNVPPTAPDMVVVSVIDNQKTEITYLPYKSPLRDFGRYELYRSLSGGSPQLIMTSKDSLKTYTQDSTLNTLQNSYCYELRVVNFCGTSSPPLPANAHCTIETSAQPLPDAVNISWNKYVGWMPEKYLIYRVKDYGTAGRKLLATVSGSATSYLDTAMFCTDPNTYRVEAVRKGQPSIISRSDTAIAAPLHQSPSETVNARVATVVDNEYVRLEWDIPTIKYAQTLHVERSVLGEPFKPFVQYPIDKAPAALNDLTANVNTRAYQYQIAIGNRCNERTTQGRIATSIFLQAKREQNTPTLRWNPYEAWENGVESYHIEVLNEATQAFEPVATLGGGETVFADDKTRLPQAHYCYRVWAQERGGNALKSLSNEACLPVPPTVFPPNAFTPNADGDNDVFIVPNAYVRSASLKIFSRWNEPVFETDDLMSGWDGVYQSIDCPEGVYPFVIDGTGWDGSHFHIIGTVTLLR